MLLNCKYWKSKPMEQIKLVATDLDGTFLKDDNSICRDDLEMLGELGKKNIVRVAATGRNLEKVREVISDDVPFDYIAFSSGAGIFDWRQQQLIFRQNMSKELANGVIDVLRRHEKSFFLFKQIPENRFCWHFHGQTSCEEFDRYFSRHNALTEPIPQSFAVDEEVSQFLVIFSGATEEFYQIKSELEQAFDEIKILRATSPLGTGYLWMEIFHKGVSKGNAIRFLCDHEDIQPEKTFGIGNDYNDLDLLEFTSYSYLVENGPDELKDNYLEAPSNEDCAFSVSIKRHL